MKLLGFNVNLVSIVLALIIGGIIACFTVCSCSYFSVQKEGFLSGGTPLDGAPLGYQTGKGVPGDKWLRPPVSSTQADENMYASLANNVGGKVPLPDDILSFFYDNQFSPDCCYKPQQYSSSTGCACISEDQMKFLSSRGGNNTLP